MFRFTFYKFLLFRSLFVLVLLLGQVAVAQAQPIDSLHRLLKQTTQDTSRVSIWNWICGYYRFNNPDSARYYGQLALTTARRIHYVKGEAHSLTTLGFAVRDAGDITEAMAYELAALQLAQDNHFAEETGEALKMIGHNYYDLNDYSAALVYLHRALRIFKQLKSTGQIAGTQMLIGQCWFNLNQLDSAAYYFKQVYALHQKIDDRSILTYILRNLGKVEARRGHTQQAFTYYRQSISSARLLNNHRSRSETYTQMAELFLSLHQRDSSVYYAQKALAEAQTGPFLKHILAASSLLVRLYKGVDTSKAFQYLQIASATQDSLYGPEKMRVIQSLMFAQQERQRENEQAQAAYQSQIRQIALLLGLAIVLLIAFFLYRNNRQKHKANQLLNKQKTKVEETLTTLRATQTQLIQKEKMASLGELTAGIAHEIQNPLNFVNNFAEVSVELAEELDQSVDAGNGALTKEISADLRQNMHHIAQNGQRAAGIVRSMLEHSRTAIGEHQPTDLNALCEEYLRLAYQGLRAKQSEFVCQLETQFDPDLPLVSVVASDMSRVLLNLYNNAFYAVAQKQQTVLADYQPTVTVSTTQTNGGIEIRVRDNGMGIPEAIQSKIFQPFFTTKPTGEGTGLGLSLSYDMVTKGHGGEMRVESHLHQYTEFMISLPIT